jgi:hypothetical protein
LGAAAAGPDAAGMAEVIEDGGAESAIRQVR